MCLFSLSFVSIFFMVVSRIFYLIRLPFCFKAIAQKRDLEYIGHWQVFEKLDLPFPPYPKTNYTTKIIDQIVMGKKFKPLFYLFYYRKYANRRPDPFAIFAFQKPHNHSGPFLIMPNRFFSDFSLEVDLENETNISPKLLNRNSMGELTPAFYLKYKAVVYGDGAGQKQLEANLKPDLMTLLLKTPYWYVFREGDWLLIYLQNNLIFGPGLEKQLDQACQIADLIN